MFAFKIPSENKYACLHGFVVHSNSGASNVLRCLFRFYNETTHFLKQAPEEYNYNLVKCTVFCDSKFLKLSENVSGSL